MTEGMDVNDIVRLFSKKPPNDIEIKNTSHGDDDFREALIVDLREEKIVIKLSSNGFTDEKHLIIWERIAEDDEMGVASKMVDVEISSR